MVLFLLGILMLVVGYFTYGKFVEKILGPDDRATPAVRNADGVDFVVLPHWKNMLIQLLNIAGIGPVIGVIIGVKFGAIVFLIIPIGNIIGGAVHDFVSGIMSMRHEGANLPALIRKTLGRSCYHAFSIFVLLCLLLVVAVFINIPANLIDAMVPGRPIFWLAVGGIFLYYICATLFPVDKIIGSIYPIFGAILIVSTLAIFGVLVYRAALDPRILTETASFQAGKFTQPIIPMLFVTIACGIISGFHATQSPIIARTMKTERQSRSSFYGMMIVEGIIAMIWAAAAMAIYNIMPETMSIKATGALTQITTYFLGSWVGGLTVVGVIILAVTSGDTAMRSIRLSIAEMCNLNQKHIRSRILLCLPVIVVVAALLWWSNQNKASFDKLWNYFAWSNQVMAATTLMAGTAWLLAVKSNRSNCLITLIPGMFMTFVVLTYILWISPAHGGPIGVGLEIVPAYCVAGVLTLILAVLTVRKGLTTKF